jgi:CRP-like cAMP-binding protein
MAKMPSATNTPDPRQSHLLAVLPEPESKRLLPYMEHIQLPLGKALYESGNQLNHVYFPTTAIVSLLYELENGSSAKIAVVGNEGIVGIALFMGGDTMPNRAVVQSEGHAYRLKGQLLQQEFNRGGVLRHLLLRCTLAMLTQMAQSVVCNRHHTVD